MAPIDGGPAAHPPSGRGRSPRCLTTAEPKRPISPPMQRSCFTAAGACGFLAVALAAIATHAAQPIVGSVAMLLGWHAPAFMAAGLWARSTLAPALWAAGLLLFGGALLLRAFADITLGPVAPTGGMLVMAGWLALAVAAWRR